MILIEISGDPIAWAAPRKGTRGFYDIKSKQKECARWQIKSQYKDLPISCTVHIDYTFYMQMPRHISTVKRKQMIAGIIKPRTKPDATNLQKLYEDCLKGIVLSDDNIVTDWSGRKRYSEFPRSILRIFPIDDQQIFYIPHQLLKEPVHIKKQADVCGL